MKPRDFQGFAEQAFGQSPAVANVAPSSELPGQCGTRIELAAGPQIYVQWVSTSPPKGAGKLGESDEVVTGPPPAVVKVPDLATSGRLRTGDIEQHLAALVNNTGHPELRDVNGYSQHPSLGSDEQRYGIRIRFHDESAIYALFRHTLRQGASPSQATDFKQQDEL